MKNIISTITLGLVLVAFGVNAQTAEKLGLYFAVDTAATGFTNSGDNVSNETDFGFGMGFRGGYSIAPQTVLFAEFIGGVYKAGSTDNTQTALLVGTEIYPVQNLFFRPSVGISWLNVDPAGAADSTSDAGFSAGLASGYQFNLNTNLSLGPTVRGTYNRVNAAVDSNLWSYGLGAELQARF